MLDYCLVREPVPVKVPQVPVRVQPVTVRVVPSVEKLPLAATLFCELGSV